MPLKVTSLTEFDKTLEEIFQIFFDDVVSSKKLMDLQMEQVLQSAVEAELDDDILAAIIQTRVDRLLPKLYEAMT